MLPDFTMLDPIARGITQEFDITLAQSEDYFGFLFEGYVLAPSDGLYSFFTVSNSGSQLFIGDELVVDNNGTHPAQERSGFIALKAGLHRISRPSITAVSAPSTGMPLPSRRMTSRAFSRANRMT